jgi:flagellar protein FliL
MAKKANEDAPDEEAEGASSEGKAPSGGKKKLILFGGVGLVALAVLGGGGYFFFGRGTPHEAGEQQALAKKPVGFLEIREMMVNLAPDVAQGPGADRARMLKFKVALEVKDPKLIPEIQPLLPRVEDTFQVFVRELRASDLEGSGGLYRLREELLRRVNYAVYPAKVEAVLFKELVVQ